MRKEPMMDRALRGEDLMRHVIASMIQGESIRDVVDRLPAEMRELPVFLVESPDGGVRTVHDWDVVLRGGRLVDALTGREVTYRPDDNGRETEH